MRPEFSCLTNPRQDDLKSLGTSVDTLTERLKSCKASGTAVSHLPPKHVSLLICAGKAAEALRGHHRVHAAG